MPSPQERQAALLRWVNTTFSIGHTVEGLDELDDGVIFAQILHELESSYDSSAIQRQTSPEDKRKNLDSVFKSIRRCIRVSYFGKGIHAPSLGFFRDVAENPDGEHLEQVLELLLGLAVSCPDNQPFVKPITSMDDRSQRVLMAIIQKQQEILRTTPAPGLDADETSDVVLDQGLLVEERLAQTNRALEQERKKLADLYNRHQHLQDSYDALVARQEEEQQEFERFRDSHGDHQSDYIKVQEQKIRERDELISAQELQMEDDRQLKERLQRELNALSKRAEQHEQLSDEVKELRHLNDDLEKRANAGERYKQKLETLKGLEAANQALQEEKNVLLTRTKDYEAVLYRNSQLETTEKMLVGRLEEYENRHIIMQDENKALLEQIRECRAAIQALEVTKAHDERVIHEQREQLQVQGAPSSTPQDYDAGTSSLEQELLQTSDPTSAFALEISRLKAENSLLRNNMAVGSENERLRKDLESAKRSEERLQDQYNDIYEKYAVGQRQVEALINNMSGEGTEAFGNVHTQALKYKMELETEASKRKAVEAELNDKKRELVAAQTQCTLLTAMEGGGLVADLTNHLGVSVNVAGTDSARALEILRDSDELVSHSLQTELTACRTEIQDLQADLSHKNAQLMEALISKDALRKKLDEADPTSTAATTVDEPKTESADAIALQERMKKADERLEKLKALYKDQKALLEKADQEKLDLQRRLKAAESGATLTAQKAAHEQIIKTLQRENALITTAWYDLASRVQSNHVVLQRRHDVPKSWLSRQRQLVNATPRK